MARLDVELDALLLQWGHRPQPAGAPVPDGNQMLQVSMHCSGDAQALAGAGFKLASQIGPVGYGEIALRLGQSGGLRSTLPFQWKYRRCVACAERYCPSGLTFAINGGFEVVSLRLGRTATGRPRQSGLRGSSRPCCVRPPRGRSTSAAPRTADVGASRGRLAQWLLDAGQREFGHPGRPTENAAVLHTAIPQGAWTGRP